MSHPPLHIPKIWLLTVY